MSTTAGPSRSLDVARKFSPRQQDSTPSASFMVRLACLVSLRPSGSTDPRARVNPKRGDTQVWTSRSSRNLGPARSLISQPRPLPLPFPPDPPFSLTLPRSEHRPLRGRCLSRIFTKCDLDLSHFH